MISIDTMSSAERDDAELVAASVAGDREAFGQIVARYQSLICSLAYSASGGLSQSEDLAQDTFLAAWKQLADLREASKLRSWLCGIARNLIHNDRRRQRREPVHAAESLDEISESPALGPLPVDQAISKEEEAILWRSLQQIPEIYREPLVLYYREHKSTARVAQELGVSEDAVHQRLTRGRRLLQAQVLAFVEGALERTKPGPAFTLDVVAALPVLAAASKSAAVAHSTSQLLKGALKIMAWTKTKTAILAGVIALLGGTSSIVGYKVWQAHGMGESSSSGLSPTMMDQIYSIEADGTVRFQGNIEEINRTSQAAHTDNIGDIDTSWSLVDASGHSMKLKRRPDHGVLVTLNKAVPPGQKIFYTMTGSMGNMVKRNQSGNYMMEMTQIQGNEHDMHLVEVWRLPTGATLVTNSPAEFTPSTNEAGQIELRLDKVVPPNGRTPLVLGYRLASAAN